MLLALSLTGCRSGEAVKAGTHSTATTTTVAAAEDEEGPAVVPPDAPVPTTPGPSDSSTCRPDPLANVYHPDRLRVITPCVTVSGTVRVVRPEADGDVHFDLELDSPFGELVNDANRAQQSGWLVVEILPADKPGCTVGQPPRVAVGTYDYGACTGAGVVTPAVGSHVSVTGPYVLDTFHGWTEVHPAWAVTPDGATATPGPGGPSPTTPQSSGTGAYYANCTAARAAGVAPLHRGDAGYRTALDRDNDGVACE